MLKPTCWFCSIPLCEAVSQYDKVVQLHFGSVQHSAVSKRCGQLAGTTVPVSLISFHFMMTRNRLLALVAHASPCQNVMLHQECHLLTISGQHEHQATKAHRADYRSCTLSAHLEGLIATKVRLEIMVSSSNPSDPFSIFKTKRRAEFIRIGLMLREAIPAKNTFLFRHCTKGGVKGSQKGVFAKSQLVETFFHWLCLDIF